MSEEKTSIEEVHELPEAVVSIRRRQISIVWFVPLVALLIGGWLVYKTISEKGPTITISFKMVSTAILKRGDDIKCSIFFKLPVIRLSMAKTS